MPDICSPEVLIVGFGGAYIILHLTGTLAFEVGAASRMYRRLGAAALQTSGVAQVCSTDLGAAVMWGGR